MNAEFIHKTCIENEYEVHIHAEAKKLFACIIIIDVEIVYSIVKYISIMDSKVNNSEIKVEYRAIFTKLIKFRVYVKLFLEIKDL